jgi:hypothetical protein
VPEFSVKSELSVIRDEPAVQNPSAELERLESRTAHIATEEGNSVEAGGNCKIVLRAQFYDMERAGDPAR